MTTSACAFLTKTRITSMRSGGSFSAEHTLLAFSTSAWLEGSIPVSAVMFEKGNLQEQIIPGSYRDSNHNRYKSLGTKSRTPSGFPSSPKNPRGQSNIYSIRCKGSQPSKDPMQTIQPCSGYKRHAAVPPLGKSKYGARRRQGGVFFDPGRGLVVVAHLSCVERGLLTPRYHVLHRGINKRMESRSLDGTHLSQGRAEGIGRGWQHGFF
ncbi:hypothetical protein JRQ81_012104 [Phrynocephalus forsythii]|uniref:Uncharacterized protein n=1 Tax=Phrynocephalus forsythii TaxID=171643 RepID=A0A9Q0X5A2_9SAUR|nr:hypothetical protein JRQ81_012104 [Phrynocephalus forsythii]